MRRSITLPQNVSATEDETDIGRIFTSTIDAYSLEYSRLNTATNNAPLAMKYNPDLVKAMYSRKDEGLAIERIANPRDNYLTHPKVTPMAFSRTKMCPTVPFLHEIHPGAKLIYSPAHARHSTQSYGEKNLPCHNNMKFVSSYYSGHHAPVTCRQCGMRIYYPSEYPDLTMSPFCLCMDWGGYRDEELWSSLENLTDAEGINLLNENL